MWYYNNVVNLSSTTVGEPCKSLICGYGGIGRRDRFRFYCQWRAGSSPVTRTSSVTLHLFSGYKVMYPVFVPVNKIQHNFRRNFCADSVSFAATFLLYLWKSHLSLTPSLLLSKTSLACLSCSFVNPLTTDKLRYGARFGYEKSCTQFRGTDRCVLFLFP